MNSVRADPGEDESVDVWGDKVARECYDGWWWRRHDVNVGRILKQIPKRKFEGTSTYDLLSTGVHGFAYEGLVKLRKLAVIRNSICHHKGIVAT